MSARVTELLETHRDELNARFARDAKELAPEAVLAYLARTVVPLLEAWTGDAIAPLLFTLFDLGLVGMRAGVIGADAESAFERVLRERMPVLTPLVERSPSTVLRALGNGFLQIGRERGPELAQWWLESVTAGAARCADRGAWFDLGVVVAWRAGIAEARDFALDRLANLDADLVHELFGATTVDRDPARRFCTPGTTTALGPLEHVATTGGFVGFDGPFASPPLPRVVAGRLVCTDGASTFEVFADRFGARCRPAMWAHGEAATTTDTGGARIDASGAVYGLGGQLVADDLRGAVAAAESNGVLAVVLGDSHKVFVVGRREVAG